MVVYVLKLLFLTLPDFVIGEKMKFIKKTILTLLMIIILISIFNISVKGMSEIVLESGNKLPDYFFVGEVYDLKVSGKTVNFKSAYPEKAKIDAETGELTLYEPGSVKITATARSTGKVVATKVITILERAKSIETNITDITIFIGDTVVIKTELIPSTSTDILRYKSDDKTIATVSLTSGVITGVGVGTTTINIYAKATSTTSNNDTGNVCSTVNVTVLDEDAVLDTAIPIQIIQNNKTIVLEESECVMLDLFVLPESVEYEITYTTDSENIEISSEGLLSALKIGNGQINVTVNPLDERFTPSTITIDVNVISIMNNTASVLSDGNIIIIVCGFVLFVSAIVVCFLRRKKD